MKRIYIVRHAKSSWDNMDLRDFERPLNDRGLRDAPHMGSRLKGHGVHPALMVTSPAIRALSTCQIIASTIGYPVEQIRTDKRIYHASEEQLLAVVRSYDALNSPDVVVMVGHNPGLTAFTNHLLDESIDNIPTCGIVAGHLNINSWEDANWGCGERAFFETPKD